MAATQKPFLQHVSEHLDIIKGIIYIVVIVFSVAYISGQFTQELRSIRMELSEIKIALKTEYVNKLEYDYHVMDNNVKFSDLKDRVAIIENSKKIYP